MKQQKSLLARRLAVLLFCVPLIVLWVIPAGARVRVVGEVWIGSFGEVVEFLDLSEDGSTLLAGTRELGVHIWRRQGSRWMRKAVIEPGPIVEATWLEGPELVLGRCEGGELVSWDLDGEERYRLPTPGGFLSADPVRTHAASADGWTVVTVAESGTLAFWDGKYGELIDISVNAYCPGGPLEIAPDGGVVAIPFQSERNPNCRFLQIRDSRGSPTGQLTAAAWPVYFDSTGQLIVTAFDQGWGSSSTAVWDARDGKMLFFSRENPHVVAALVLAANPDARDAAETSAMLWGTMSSRQPWNEDSRCDAGWNAIPGGLPVIASSDRGDLQFCDPTDDSRTSVHLAAEGSPFDLASDGRTATVGTEGGSVVVLSLERVTRDEGSVP